MIQSTAATLRLAVPPGATAPGAPVAVGGGGVFTLPGVGTGGGEATPGATMPDFAAMMVAVPAGDRQGDAATGKSLPMPVVSPTPVDASAVARLPAAVISSMPQPAPTAADDDDGFVTCGLIVGKPLGLKPIGSGDAQPLPVPTPKVPLPTKSPLSGASPMAIPVRPATPPIAGTPMVPLAVATPAAVTPTAPQAAPPPQGTPADDEPILSSSPIIRNDEGAPAVPLAGGKSMVPPITVAPPQSTPPSPPTVDAEAATPAAPFAKDRPATPRVTSPRPTVTEDFPQPVDIISVDFPVDADAPAAAPHKLPRPKSGEPVEPVPDDRAVVPVDAAPPALPIAPAAVMPMPFDPATPIAAAPSVASPGRPAAVAAHPVAEKAITGATLLRPAAPSMRNPTPIGEPASPTPMSADPVGAGPVAPEQILVASDTPAAPPPATTLRRSVPIVEYPQVQSPEMPVGGVMPSPPAATAIASSPAVVPDDTAAPIVALAAAVPIAGAVAQPITMPIAQPTPPAASPGAASTPPRDEVAAMATAMKATITTLAPRTAPTPTQREAVAPAVAATAATNLARPVEGVSLPAASVPPTPLQAGGSVAPPPASVATATATAQTPAVTLPTPAPAGVAEGPVVLRGAEKPAIEAPIAAPLPAPAPCLSPASVGTTASAGIVFGAARMAAQRSEHEDRILTLGSEALAATTAPAERLAVAATQAGSQPSLDMTDQRWPHAMVAHIEALRDAVADAANATDTRIRLVPDALGGIDIGVRQDGDTLHVHFAADQPQTRALLQEAQPRLAEAAEARGLKLGQTSVGTDAGQGQQRQQQSHQPAAQPARRNSFTATATTDEAGDGRIA